MVAAALAWIEVLRGELERASAHVRSAEQLLPNDVFWVSLKAPAAELALARGQPEEVPQMVDIGAGIPHVYAAFFTPLLVLAVRAEAELAQRARSDREAAAEREAVTRAEALLGWARTLTGPEAWPLGSAPDETLLEVELCELETLRARGEDRADAWSTVAARWAERAVPTPRRTRDYAKPKRRSPRKRRGPRSRRPWSRPVPRPSGSAPSPC
jgi:hypothetical protein